MGLCYSKEPSVKGEPDERSVGCFHRKPRRKHDKFYQNNEFCVPPKKGMTSTSHHSSTIPVGSNDRLPSCCSHLGTTTTTNSSVSRVPCLSPSMGFRQASAGSTTERESLEEVDNVDLVASLQSSPLFHDAGEELIHRLASLMQFVRYFDGDVIIQKGQKAKSTDCIYCVASGEVTLKITNSRGECEGIIKNAGWVFGENSVVFNSPRSMSVTAHGVVKLYTLSKIDFLNSMQNTQKIRLLKFLRKLPFLHSISDDKLIEFSPMIEIKEFDKGDLILDQRNQKNNSFYIIRRGTVSMVQEGLENDGLGGSDLMEGDELNRGDFFGLDEEIGAIYHASSSPTEVLTIKHEHLQKSGNISLFWKLIEDSLTAILNDLGTVDVSSLRLGNIANQKYLKLAREGDVVLEQGRELKHLFLVVQGRISFIPSSTQSSSSSLIKSLNGTMYFGEEWTQSSTATGSIMVTSTRLQYLQIPHKLLTQGGNSRAHGPNSRPRISERIQNAFSIVKDSEQRPIEFQQLKQYRVVGEGQYGKVRLVVHRKTGEKFALKIIQKNAVRDLKTVEHIIMERRILSQLSGRNFLVGFHGAFQDNCALYLLMDWIPGGELFSRITMNGMLPESHAVFYAANVVLAFNTMHRMSIVYRDLKPENILIDRNGFLRLSDYGFATIDDSSALTICGTPDYQAPEIILRKGAQKASDYWALGILIFEMLTGDAPFKSDSEDPLDSYRKILSGKFHIPSYVSSSAAALITDLLQVDPMRRLGYQSADGEAIKSHPWFRTVDWEKMENQNCRAPFIPRLASALDTSCFDRYDDSTKMSPPSPKHDFFSKDQEWAKLWTWIDTF